MAFDKSELINVWLHFVGKNFKDYDYRKYAVPKSYKNLNSDSEFLVMLKINQSKKEGTIRRFINMQVALREVLTQIEKSKVN